MVAIGFAVWWHINIYAKGACAQLALPLVAIYPFMEADHLVAGTALAQARRLVVQARRSASSPAGRDV